MEGKLKIEGFRMDVDLILKSRHKPYMNSQLFAQYTDAKNGNDFSIGLGIPLWGLDSKLFV
jgi:hypothetical protein